MSAAAAACGAWPDAEARLGALCDHARTVETITAAQRRGNIAARLGLPSDAWPETKLTLTAVDLATQALTAFTAQSGVALVDAVAASCAVPGIWPPAEINGRLYIDGGVWRTAENAHLAAGAKLVLILSPRGWGY